MKILVIGLGSMGKRRIRLLQKIDAKCKLIGIDQDANRAKEAKETYGIDVCPDVNQALQQDHVDCAIICTSPDTHAKLIQECLENGLHVFSEINLVEDGYEDNIALAQKMDRVLFLSSTFLYREEIGYITQQVRQQKNALNYTYHVGQYLPDWHPWERIDDFFVSKKRTNGCRELFAIELPWIIHAFGEIERIEALRGKNTALHLDYQDNYLLLIQHKTGHKGVLAVDVMSRKAVRNLEVYGEELYLSWNGTPEGLKNYDYDHKREETVNLYNQVETTEGYASFVIENAYENELRAFLKEIETRSPAIYTFEDDLHTLRWIDRIEENG